MYIDVKNLTFKKDQSFLNMTNNIIAGHMDLSTYGDLHMIMDSPKKIELCNTDWMAITQQKLELIEDTPLKKTFKINRGGDLLLNFWLDRIRIISQ